MIRSIILLILMGLALPVWAEGPWEEGTHYTRLDSPVGTDHPEKIVVAEVFWYGCPHCYRFKPLVESWAEKQPEDVKFVHWPAALNPSWAPHARAFIVAKSLGVLDKVHDPLFKALAGERRQDLNSQEGLAAFFAEHGVDAEKFNRAWNSFGVNAIFDKLQSRIRGARVTGTPALIVDGRYVISARQAGNFDNMLKVADHLVEKERAR